MLSYAKARVRTEAKSTGSVTKPTWPPGKFISGVPRRPASATAVRWGNSPFDAVPPATMSRVEAASRAGKSGGYRAMGMSPCAKNRVLILTSSAEGGCGSPGGSVWDHGHAREGGEGFPRGTDALLRERVVDVVESRWRPLGLWQEQGQWRLMRDEGFDVVWIAGDQGESSHRATTAAKDVGGHFADGRLEHPAYVVGQQVRFAVLVKVVDRAVSEASWVVGHDRVGLSQRRCNGGKSRCVHWVTDQHERRARALYLVVQTRSGDVQHVARR